MSGRIRSIKPEILEDAVTAGLSETAFRLFIGTIALADDYGVFRAEAGYLAGQVFWKVPPSRPVDEAVAELGAKLVQLYEVNASATARSAPGRSTRRSRTQASAGSPPLRTSSAPSLRRLSGDPRERLRSSSRNPPERHSGACRELLRRRDPRACRAMFGRISGELREPFRRSSRRSRATLRRVSGDPRA